jgi:hypothetical protein
VTGPEHYVEAETCLDRAYAIINSDEFDGNLERVSAWLGFGHVHALLAGGAAAALSGRDHGLLTDEYNMWLSIAGTPEDDR